MGSVFDRAARAAAVSLFALGAAATAAALTPGCSDAQTSDAAETSACPPGQKCQVHLTLLHTADIHSRLLPYDLLVTQVDSDLGLGKNGELKNVGGVARMSYVIGRERARANRVLHLDSGDCFQGAPIFNFYSGEPEVRSMSALGTDAMVIGNHEFDRGALNVYRRFEQWSDFPLLAANYKFDDPRSPFSTSIGTILHPFTVLNADGLKVGVIGMGNLSSLASVFDQPNNLGITPLNTVEVAQFYIDLLRPYVDVVVMLTHLGLEVDQRMIRNTTGIDVVLGGHNHIVINPPQQLEDCSADPSHPGFIWQLDPNVPYDPGTPPPAVDPVDPSIPLPDPVNHPYMYMRKCTPRRVLLAHSGAFAKYVGRLDLELSNDPAAISPTGDPKGYEPVNGFEVVSSNYQPFPIDDSIPDDPVIVDMLQPYRRTLDLVADLNILVGFSPLGAKRTAPQGGDSPLGNLVASAMWLRLGVQTDFSMTNSTGIRTDLNPGPVTIEEMYNIFPFDNSITKMQLSGHEVQEMFDFIARRSTGRGCVAQSQIAGARVRINCAGCNRPGANAPCNDDTDCIGGAPGSCVKGTCNVESCAEEVYIGHASCTADSDCGANVPAGSCQNGQCTCAQDADCGQPVQPGVCDKPLDGEHGTCLLPISEQNLYELATSNYLAGGGSGFRTLQRNTTQFDTGIQQRDALIDYLRQGKPCGFRALDPDPAKRAATDYWPDTGLPNRGDDGLRQCEKDSDCAGEGDFVCACANATESTAGGTTTCVTSGACDRNVGRCVRRDCRDDVHDVHERQCASSPDREGCSLDLDACSIAGEQCKYLSCVDQSIGNFTDNRVEMIGR